VLIHPIYLYVSVLIYPFHPLPPLAATPVKPFQFYLDLAAGLQVAAQGVIDNSNNRISLLLKQQENVARETIHVGRIFLTVPSLINDSYALACACVWRLRDASAS
jgi:hypothetical protein